MRTALLPLLATFALVPPAQQGPRTASPGRPAQAGPAATSRQGSSQGARGFAVTLRPAGMPPPQTNRAYLPRGTVQRTLLPDAAYWQSRDLLQEIQWMSRRGFIPVTAAGDAAVLTGASYFPAGWIAYGFVVPAKEKLHVRLHHPNEGWFRLVMVDRWGQLREGMLQNLIPTGNPEVSYTNPREAPNTVYVIVDDPGWMSSKGNPFTLNVDRSWDPAKAAAPALPPVHGVFAQVKAEPPRAEKPSPS